MWAKASCGRQVGLAAFGANSKCNWEEALIWVGAECICAARPTTARKGRGGHRCGASIMRLPQINFTTIAPALLVNGQSTGQGCEILLGKSCIGQHGVAMGRDKDGVGEGLPTKLRWLLLWPGRGPRMGKRRRSFSRKNEKPSAQMEWIGATLDANGKQLGRSVGRCCPVHRLSTFASKERTRRLGGPLPSKPAKMAEWGMSLLVMAL